ncbi:hypothetical protein [Stappia sp. WLB 29]|uniref:hypothetical protein n=1 Tax=Stappia sp. WLB 29 TaxID=2925220 RepID=UPI0020C0B228|nr:hypothetical protein [Stappia sp. WLB 29]
MSLSNLPLPIRIFLEGLVACGSNTTAKTMASRLDRRLATVKPLAHWLEFLSGCSIRLIRAVDERKRAGEAVVTTLTVTRGPEGGEGETYSDWRFVVHDGRVAVVAIEDRTPVRMPPTVGRFLRAANCLDAEGMLATFASDAFVDDQFSDYWGRSAIADWASRDVVGRRLTFYVVNALDHYGEVIVTVTVNGNFDWLGLPDPVIHALYFRLSSDRIVSLIILPKQ